MDSKAKCRPRRGKDKFCGLCETGSSHITSEMRFELSHGNSLHMCFNINVQRSDPRQSDIDCQNKTDTLSSQNVENESSIEAWACCTCVSKMSFCKDGTFLDVSMNMYICEYIFSMPTADCHTWDWATKAMTPLKKPGLF